METLENEVASATKSKKQVEIVLSKANMKLKKEVDTLNAQNKKLGGQVQVLVKVGSPHSSICTGIVLLDQRSCLVDLCRR